MAEIDENLIRADLSPAEQAMHVDARKVLYEKIHPETKQGGAPGKAGGGKKTKDANVASFVEDTAVRTGKAKRTVALDAKRGKGGKGWLRDVAGTSLDKGDEIDALIELPDAERGSLIGRAKAGEKVSAKTVFKQIARALREADLAGKQAALPDKHYGVIYADPPWKFEPYSNRSAENHYPTMDLNDILSLKVPAADDCVLFLWARVPMLPQALRVMDSWGFDYVSNYVWVKDRVGTGYWGRNKHELLLIGTRGNIPAPAPGTQPISAITAPTDGHSTKPPEFRKIIEQMFPNLPRLEMFARGSIDGWDVFGNESEKAA
jgi:N6-adenosine-specific RNA methylase IME4